MGDSQEPDQNQPSGCNDTREQLVSSLTAGDSLEAAAHDFVVENHAPSYGLVEEQRLSVHLQGREQYIEWKSDKQRPR